MASTRLPDNPKRASSAMLRQHEFRLVQTYAALDGSSERYAMVCHVCGGRMNQAPEHCIGKRAV